MGRMPYQRCAKQVNLCSLLKQSNTNLVVFMQMSVAYDVCVNHQYDSICQPMCLNEAARDHENLCKVSHFSQSLIMSLCIKFIFTTVWTWKNHVS